MCIQCSGKNGVVSESRVVQPFSGGGRIPVLGRVLLDFQSARVTISTSKTGRYREKMACCFWPPLTARATSTSHRTVIAPGGWVESTLIA